MLCSGRRYRRRRAGSTAQRQTIPQGGKHYAAADDTIKRMETDMREKLEALIKEAYAALSELQAYTTQENQNALRYLISQAEAVLRGEDICPVSHSRAFLEMEEEAWMSFAASHYVMYAFDRREGQEGEFFGLKQALNWFVRSDVRKGPEGFAETAKESRSERSFAFEQEGQDYLLFSKEEWERIKERIKTDPLCRRQYEKIRAVAERMSKERLAELWDRTMNGARLPEEEELYSDTAKGISFLVPEGAKKAVLRFTLPEEAAGLQEFRIRNVRIAGADQEELKVDQEEPVVLGKEALCREWKTPFGVAPGAVYTIHFQVNQRTKLKKGILLEICFEDGEGNSAGSFCREYNRKAWYHNGALNLDMQCNAICYAVTGGHDYARKAMYQLLLFLDEFCQGALYWMRYNARPEGRDSYGAVQAGRNLCAVAMTYAFIKNAPVWEEEGEQQSSGMSRRERFIRLTEFILNDVADLRDRTCLTPERAQRGTGNWQTDMFIGAAMAAAAVEEIPYRKQWIENAQAVLRAQMSCNLNPDGSWPESLRYHHAALEHFCTFARFWEHETGENWFYDNHLERMFAYTIGTQMPPYAYFGHRISTPPFGDHKLGDGSEYQILGSWISRVAETDAVLAKQMKETWERAGCPVKEPGGEAVVAELLLAGTAGEERLPIGAAEEEPAQQAAAAQIKRVTSAQGQLLTDYRTKSRAFPDAGLYLFRREHDDKTQSCLTVMCNRKRIGHGHLDQGSFLFYFHDVPVIMDSGIEGYFDATTQWHLSSLSHACMLFKRKREMQEESAEINLNAGNYAARLGWCDTPGTATPLACKMEDGQEWIRMRIENPEGEGIQIRTVSLNQDDTVQIRDEVRDFEGKVLFSLPMLAKRAEVTEKDGKIRIVAEGYYRVNLEVESLRPVRRVWVENGRVTPMYPQKEEISTIPYLRMTADAKEGFEVVIKCTRNGEISL